MAVTGAQPPLGFSQTFVRRSGHIAIREPLLIQIIQNERSQGATPVLVLRKLRILARSFSTGYNKGNLYKLRNSGHRGAAPPWVLPKLGMPARGFSAGSNKINRGVHKLLSLEWQSPGRSSRSGFFQISVRPAGQSATVCACVAVGRGFRPQMFDNVRSICDRDAGDSWRTRVGGRLGDDGGIRLYRCCWGWG